MNLTKTTLFVATGDLGTADAEDKACTLYRVYQDAAHCPYCRAARFRLRSAGRRQPYFVCDGCGQRLDIE